MSNGFRTLDQVDVNGKRVLLRVDIDSAVEADQVFAQLLGKDPAERYRIIMDEAGEADDLDV